MFTVTRFQQEQHAEMLRRRQVAERAAAAVVPPAAAVPGGGPGSVVAPAGGTPLPAAVKGTAPDVGKRKFTAEQRRRLAREGKALPDGSYPIDSAADLEPAAILARSGHGDVPAAERLIARRAEELGQPDPLTRDGGKADGETRGKPGPESEGKPRRKPREKPRGGREGKPGDRDMATDAHDMARGHADAMAADRARKTFSERGAHEGPGDLMAADRPEPEDFSRPYTTEGHAAQSPQHAPPRENPIPAPYGRGFPVPIEMTPSPAIAGNAGPLTQALGAHQARVTMSTPIPGRNR